LSAAFAECFDHFCANPARTTGDKNYFACEIQQITHPNDLTLQRFNPSTLKFFRFATLARYR
jgi:hypothetical protein